MQTPFIYICVYIHYIRTIYTIYIHPMAHYIHTSWANMGYSLYIHYIHTTHALYIHTIHTLYVYPIYKLSLSLYIYIREAVSH